MAKSSEELKVYRREYQRRPDVRARRLANRGRWPSSSRVRRSQQSKAWAERNPEKKLAIRLKSRYGCVQRPVRGSPSGPRKPVWYLPEATS